jgi:hypothetical protein
MGLYAGCADVLKIESGDRSIGPGRLGNGGHSNRCCLRWVIIYFF